MEQVGVLLMMLGILTYFVAHAVFVIVAFRMSAGAGIAALFFGCLFYIAMIVMNPQQSWKPLAIGVAGVILFFIGGCMVDASPQTAL